MIATIPPLWRDSDAYLQVTEDPVVATFWGHGPAYCYAARVPLFLGAQWERWQGTEGASHETGTSHLTNTGIWLLVVAQHLALCSAALYFILTISRFFLIRLALALLWASNALFYTLAHCVGSETLSMIVVALVVTKGLRLIRSCREPLWTDWYIFAIGLWLCLLSRHINLCLILLLPTAFLLSWIQDRISMRFAASGKPNRWRRQLRTRDLRYTLIAIAIGVACFAVASYSTRSLAGKSELRPHSRIGFTFLWRLHFLKNLSPQSRDALLQKVTARAHSRKTRQLVELLQQMHREGADLDAAWPFIQRAIPLLFPPGENMDSKKWQKLDRALNQMAFAFLLPPTIEHWRVARKEFAGALRMPVTDISFYLFVTTVHYFQHKAELPACAELATFRDWNEYQILQMHRQYPYFRLWQGLTGNKASLIWLISLLAFTAVARRKRMDIRGVAAFGITLAGVGFLMTATTCLLGGFLPRYGLPMWELLWLSLFVFLAGTANLFAKAQQ